MKCSKCEGDALRAKTVASVEVDRCERRGGLWFDESELTAVLEGKGAGARSFVGSDSGLDGKPGNCPRDGGRLLRIYSKQNRSVVVDRCSQCNGVWLDGGEFQRLTR
ncbi:MAG: hypothetical protein M2R45_04233 [Verrucomicrobia subdivision 3 bacterium]|nr:hypothetical protein [Limisphaerales bacterium]MCS1412642.1 hypothetical protein [Limisphaerales bacterium]